MLTTADRAQIAELGIAVEEVERQLRLFAAPPPPPRLDRPCTPGDGIRVLASAERTAAHTAYQRAAVAGRLSELIPASGAATRMFQALLTAREQGEGLDRAALAARAPGDKATREVLEFVDNVDRFAFADLLRGALARAGHDIERLRTSGPIGPILAALLDTEGLDYAALPKALLLFHRYPDGARSAFEEHLGEGAAFARDVSGIVRMHFTVSPEHEPAFRALLARVRPSCERRSAARFEIGFSTQPRTTDTIAVDPSNQPFRTADGRVLFRPGGHGALIENLNAVDGDVVFLKTIDNIQPEHLRGAAAEWLRLLSGHLVALQAELADHLTRLSVAAVPYAADVAAARRFAADGLGADVAAAATAADLLAQLDRPLRVCGVVRNTGEPGGGPFWVRGSDGRCSRQIVESAQVDSNDPAQRDVFAAATHFNPVLMACAVRDRHGRAFDLRRFVDPSAVFIAHKSSDGCELKALEHPGLWNGAMAHWHTVFVEVPLDVFTPVKTVNDLLRPAHQPPESSAKKSTTDEHR